MVSLLGGPADLLDRPARYLPHAPVTRAVRAGTTGRVLAIDGRAIGLAIIHLGGGRHRANHAIRHDVGITQLYEIGWPVEPDSTLGIVHAHDEASADRAVRELLAAFTLGAGQPPFLPLIIDRVA
jgi:thymidine phosphorylase